jgi:hypothetical protein
MTDKQLARDIASELLRRQRRRKLFFVAALAAAVICAVLYGTCGHGWGLGKGGGAGTGLHPVAAPAGPDAGPRRCTIRIAASGITVDGKPMTRDQAVAACKVTTGADAIVTGDARQGDWDELRAALGAAGVQVNTRAAP